MKRSVFIPALLALSAGLVTGAAHRAGANQSDNFVALLSGREEVPVRATKAHGVAILRLSADGTELHYRLNAANIANVVGAHLHLAPKGVNGPVVVGLYSAPPAGGRVNGPLVEGVITEEDLRGPLAGQSLSDLVAELQSGMIYVNVHTNDGVAPTNTGPGDFPGGEIRGQVDRGDGGK